MSYDPTESSALPRKFSPDDILPPVEPPNARFVMQLVVTPLLIVSIMVGVWMLFSWLAHMGNDPRQLVQQIRGNRESSWQQAVTLASMLDNPSAEYKELRADPQFAKEIGGILTDEMQVPVTDKARGDNKLKVRYFLCRTLGRLQSESAIEPLILAATTERSPAELDVRLGAIEGLAEFASNDTEGLIAKNPAAMKALMDCSRATDDSNAPSDSTNPNYHPHGEIRGAAAFALGIVGGEEALNRLAQMTNDLYPSVRYNAASGLARHGDARATDILLEMLDPASPDVATDEARKGEQTLRRAQVIENGIVATERLLEKGGGESTDRLKAALQSLASSNASAGVSNRAKETLSRFEKR